MNSKFDTAKTISSLVQLLGWAVMALGAIAGFSIFAEARSSDEIRQALGVAIGLGGVISGVSLVMFGQLAAAQIVTAESNAEILAILKNRNRTGRT